jgi:hypothetical protein
LKFSHSLGGRKAILKGVIGEFVLIDYLRHNGFEIDKIEWARLSMSGPIVSLKSIYCGGAAQPPFDIEATRDKKRYLIEVKHGEYARLERNQLEHLRFLAGTANLDGTTNVPVIARIRKSFGDDNDEWEIDWKEVQAISKEEFVFGTK